MKFFENAEIEIISFSVADVITTSGGSGFDTPIDPFNNADPTTYITGVSDL